MVGLVNTGRDQSLDRASVSYCCIELTQWKYLPPNDCPQGGDDVRLCLLKTLGAHNQRVVPCVGCHRDMIVYDRYPLVDGVFFLSPVCHFGPPTEVMYDGKRNYLQQLCATCLWSDWRCNNCGRDGWFNGKSIVLGTLYYYDIVSAGKCCPPTCTVCRSPLLVPENIMMQIVNVR
ncbi:unnamed protein product [Nippostrongylus brasiliensis]|uniref:Headcase domain-containing protein n=1 Tax=Nippostrongylus brasiliensis TaxID=27835 RepID=A0A0N4XIE9_NIPBR|nr:unnamed protein product [Nippostrongylus brasiliensis]